MGVDMYLYLPVDPACDFDNPPTIDVDGPRVAEFIKNFQPPAEEEEEEDGYGYGRRRDTPVESKAITAYHKDKVGWMDVLAWSHGCSNGSTYNGRNDGGTGSMQDISITKWSDNASPVITVMVMSGDILPHGILRCYYRPKEGKMKIIEYHLKQVSATSISTGGSGGEDRLTENISITFGVMFCRHCEMLLEDGSFVTDVRGGWDLEKKKGDRQGVFNPLSLRNLCHTVVTKNIDIYDEDTLSKLPRQILETIGYSHVLDRNKIPMRGRAFYATTEDVANSGETLNHFREFRVRDLTVPGLKKALAQLYQTTEDKISKVFAIRGSSLVLFEQDKQVKELSETSCVAVEIAA